MWQVTGGVFCVRYMLRTKNFFFFPQCHHMSLMDFIVSPPGCGRSVTDFWGLNAHEAQLRCPNEVDGDIWIWITRRGLNLSSTKLPRPWPPREPSPSRKNTHGRISNWTQDLMISSQKLRPLTTRPWGWSTKKNVIEHYHHVCQMWLPMDEDKQSILPRIEEIAKIGLRVAGNA
jgi:hypothetical protein